MPLWQIGLILWILAGLANAALIHFGVGGILRELMRLAVLAGLVLFIAGLIVRKKK